MCEIDWSVVAAWVQAIGSVLAIFAAVWVGERSSKQSRDLVDRERRRQADIVASTISMKLHLVGVELQKKSQHALEISTQVKSGQIVRIEKEALIKFFLLTQHEAIVQLRSNVILFDRDTGILSNTALDVLDGYNPAVESSIRIYGFKGSNPAGLIELCGLVHERMTYVAEICAEAENRLEKVHGLESDAEDQGGAP